LIIATAILVSSLAFALLHLPALLTLGDPTGVNIAAAMAANVIAGLVFGTVFAARGLEAAMGTHAGAHVVGFALTSLFIST
jgi:membrane protease YdiL (CAAX protease family)